MLKPVLKIIFILETSFLLFKESSSAVQLKNNCKEECSNIYDPVCGLLVTPNKEVFKRFHNNCQFRKIKCIISSVFSEYSLMEVEPTDCGLPTSARRLLDSSIIGGYQACNHTCPTYCLDVYKPVCAQIWKKEYYKEYSTTYDYKPMLNHCHADLFSCVLKVNISLQPFLSKCFQNNLPIGYILSVATLRSMKFFNKEMPKKRKTRRSLLNWIERDDFRDLLKMAE